MDPYLALDGGLFQSLELVPLGIHAQHALDEDGLLAGSEVNATLEDPPISCIDRGVDR